MKMRSKFSRIPDIGDFVSPSGDAFRVVYAPSRLPNGEIKLRESDKVDIQDEINSWADSCDLGLILDRVMRGDTSLLGQGGSGFYGDVSEFPTDFRSVLDLVNAGKDFFEGLPAEVRAGFNNDVYEFFRSLEYSDIDKLVSGEIDFDDSADDAVDEGEVS